MEKQYNDEIINESMEKVYEMVKRFPDTLEPPVKDRIPKVDDLNKLGDGISNDSKKQEDGKSNDSKKQKDGKSDDSNKQEDGKSDDSKKQEAGKSNDSNNQKDGISNDLNAFVHMNAFGKSFNLFRFTHDRVE
jgi:hypothetical protein